MNNLKVNNHHDWEEICKHLAKDLVYKKTGEYVEFVSYGRNGQKQYGVDLIPSQDTLIPIVVQCKELNSNLSFQIILSELKKTDSFRGKIEHYIIFTTAPKDTTLQDYFYNGENSHTRPNGEKFQVHVYYWDDINPYEEPHRRALINFFPQLLQTVEELSPNKQYIESVNSLKSIIPNIINNKNLEWLESWNFSCEYVLEKDFDPFLQLYIEHDRMLHALNGVRSFLAQGNVSTLAKTLPAGERLFFSLSELCESISGQITTSYLSDGSRILSILDIPNNNSIINQWYSNALSLAKVYREDVLGEYID